MVNLGANIEFIDSNKETPIYYAFSAIKSDFIKKVLGEFTICVDKEDVFKQLPLH